MVSLDLAHDASLELHPISREVESENDDPPHRRESTQLAPVDTGRAAWTVLIAGFVFEAIFWGFPTCFGVFQNHYSSLPQFRHSTSNIALIGTVAQSLYYLGAPFAAFATMMLPNYQRHMIWLGWFLAVMGLATASFADSVGGLIASQGLLYGLGFVTMSYPIVSMINEWWVARKGMAFGMISASSGLTGAVLPFILEALLAKYGYRTTLRACAVGAAVLTFPLLFLLKGRLPPMRQGNPWRAMSWTFVKRPLFWLFATSIIIQGLGFFFPPVFLPTYAASLDLPSIDGALLLSLMSIAQVLGQFSFGFLSDQRFSVSTLSLVCCLAAAIAALTLWGFATSMAVLVPFSLIYGFFGFGFGTMRVAMGKAVSDDPSSVFSTYAIFVFLQGVGNILVGPLSATLIRGSVQRQRFGISRIVARNEVAFETTAYRMSWAERNHVNLTRSEATLLRCQYILQRRSMIQLNLLVYPCDRLPISVEMLESTQSSLNSIPTTPQSFSPNKYSTSCVVSHLSSTQISKASMPTSQQIIAFVNATSTHILTDALSSLKSTTGLPWYFYTFFSSLYLDHRVAQNRANAPPWHILVFISSTLLLFAGVHDLSENDWLYCIVLSVLWAALWKVGKWRSMNAGVLASGVLLAVAVMEWIAGVRVLEAYRSIDGDKVLALKGGIFIALAARGFDQILPSEQQCERISANEGKGEGIA